MKPSLERKIGIFTILFAPSLIGLFLIYFVFDFRSTKIPLAITITCQVIWLVAIFIAVNGSERAQRRWDVRKILFILRRIVVIFSPAIIFAIFKFFGFIDFSKFWIAFFVIAQFVMFYYQFFKGRDKIGKNDPSRVLPENEYQETLSILEEK